MFVCTHCDTQYKKWEGRCAECGKWSTIVNESEASVINNSSAELVKLTDVSQQETKRVQTNIPAIDELLGGGITQGSLSLLGGEPGVGKSTLLLQFSQKLKGHILYVCGEESPQQIAERAQRLQINNEELSFLTDTTLETIIETASRIKPTLLIIDSIQTIYSNDVDSEKAVLNHQRITAAKLMRLAKNEGVTIIVTSQITKDGSVAGPKTVEHLVDTVLYLEGDKTRNLRILRVNKNRFGTTDDVAIFEMTPRGLDIIQDPSGIFLENENKKFPGSVVTATLEGSKVFLVESQALVTKTVFGYPQRKTAGYDTNRMQLLTAVIEKRAGLNIATHDIHLNIVGGYKVKDTGTDLAVAASIISAFNDKAAPEATLFLGEVGLGGEIRHVQRIESRIKTAEKQGFKKIIGPKVKKNPSSGIQYIPVQNITDILELF